MIRYSIFLLFCLITSVQAAEEPIMDSLPTDPRLLYNYGAQCAASGEYSKAVEVLRHAAVVRDQTIAAQALFLLGQVYVASAKQSLSEKPSETLPEQRQAVLNHIQSAEQAFMESLLLPVSNQDRVRQTNQAIETVRAWRKNMTDVWEQYDREQLRNSDWQRRIAGLANWEEKLIETVKPAQHEPDSPRQSQLGYETGKDQRTFADELAILQETPLPDTLADEKEMQERWARLPEIQQIARDAGTLLTQCRWAEALPQQQTVLDYLRALIKQNQQEQNQDQQNQDQQNQDQQNQDQQNQDQQNQDQQNQENQEQQSQQDQQNAEQQSDPQQEMDEGQKQNEGQKQSEASKEKAERLLMQVRRKEQAAEKRREQIKALLMQAEPVEKDW